MSRESQDRKGSFREPGCRLHLDPHQPMSRRQPTDPGGLTWSLSWHRRRLWMTRRNLADRILPTSRWGAARTRTDCPVRMCGVRDGHQRATRSIASSSSRSAATASRWPPHWPGWRQRSSATTRKRPRGWPMAIRWPSLRPAGVSDTGQRPAPRGRASKQSRYRALRVGRIPPTIRGRSALTFGEPLWPSLARFVSSLSQRRRWC